MELSQPGRNFVRQYFGRNVQTQFIRSVLTALRDSDVAASN